MVRVRVRVSCALCACVLHAVCVCTRARDRLTRTLPTLSFPSLSFRPIIIICVQIIHSGDVSNTLMTPATDATIKFLTGVSVASLFITAVKTY